MHGKRPKLPCMLHETCVLHAYRFKWNLHITCTKVSACHHLKYACNMHVTCTRFRIGYVAICMLSMHVIIKELYNITYQ